MNMIVRTSDLVGFEAENQKTKTAARKAALSKLLASWETKQANRAKKIGGLGLLAVSLAACNSDDSSELTDASGVAHATVDAAITSNDAAITTAATTAALTDAGGTSYSTVDAAITSNDAAITTAATTAALTDAGGTAHATVDAAITSNDAAITSAALTDASGTSHASVDAAITSNDTAATNASVAASTSFTTLTELVSAYNTLVAPKTPALTADTDIPSLGTGDDNITGTSANLATADIITDSSTTDNDTLTITAAGDITNAMRATIANIENVNFTLESFTATGTTGDAIFEIAADNISNAKVINVDLNKTGSGISSATVTGLGTGNNVVFTSDFSTAVIVTGGTDNEALTATSAAAAMTANSAGTLTAATMTSTSTAATTMTTDSDAAATLTSAADMTISAASATTVIATSTGGSIDANTTDLTAATSVTLTAKDEVNVGLEAATSATISAGGTTASTIDDALGDTLTSLSLSGNATAHEFSILNSEGVSSITITGDQNVTVTASMADIDGLTDNKISVTDSSSATSTLKVGTAVGDMDLSAAGVDVIDIAFNNNTKTATVASGANVTVSVDQTATTIDGLDAGAATNSVTVKLDDGATGTNATVDVGTSLTFTDFKTATVDVSSDTWTGGTMTASSITGLTASADNTDVTIEAGANGVTLATTANTGTGTLTINSSGAVGIGATDVTSGGLVATGSGAVTATGLTSANITNVTTGSGNDAITFSNIANSTTITTNAGNDNITISGASFADKTTVINGGDGADTLTVGGSIDLNNGTAFTLNSIETIKMANTVTAVTVGRALLDGSTYILDHTTEGDNLVLTVEMGTGTSLNLSSMVVNTANLTVADRVDATGTAGADTLTGLDGMENRFVGGDGADNITGGSVADTLTGGNGDDTISGGAGNDTIIGSAGADNLTGGAGDDNITGGAGADTLTGGAGNDSYDYDGASEIASGESIVEAASGGTDILNVDATADFTNLSTSSLDEIEQVDIAAAVTATFTGDHLTGETIELVSPNAGDAQAVVVNLAFGGTVDLTNTTVDASWTVTEDSITINGLGGNETITGTASNDTINLGAGVDTVKVAHGGAGVDTIGGFTVGASGDSFDFTGATSVNDAAGGDLDTDGFLLTPNLNALALADGLTIVSGALATAIDAAAYLTAAEIATFCADIDSGTGGNQAITVSTAADKAYLLVEGQAGNSTLALVTGGANTAIDNADVTLIAHFTARESEDFLAANFADFA